MPRVTFSSLPTIGVDETNGVLKGAIIVSKGEAKGHGLYVGDAMLDEVAKLRSLAFRVDPPAEGLTDHGGAMAIEGEVTNFRRDGDDVRGDVQLLDLPGGKRERVLKLAKTVPHLFGLSLDLTYRVIGVVRDKLKEMVPTSIKAVDLVKEPGAARALFSAAPVDTPPAASMNHAFLRKQCAKFSLAFPAEDKDVTAEIAAQAETDLEAKFAARETELTDARAKLQATPPAAPPAVTPAPAAIDYDKIIDGVTAKLQAKGLATQAAPPAKPSATGDADPTADAATAKLSLKLRNHAAKLKVKPEELAAKLGALTAQQQAVVLELGLDPESFAADHAKLHKITEMMPL